MAAVIGSILAELGVDKDGLANGLRAAGVDVTNFENKTGRQFQKMDRDTSASFANMGRSAEQFAKRSATALGLAATAAATALSVMVRNTINEADSMSKLAQSIGIGVEELSRLKYAADMSGVSLGSLGNAIGILSRQMAEAAKNGTSAAAKAFKALEISVKDSAGNLRSSTDVMIDVSDRFGRMQDGAQKTALAMDIFGKSGKDMIPLLNAGSAGLAELLAEADKLGIVLDENTGKAAEAFNDALARIGKAKDGLVLKLTAQLLPSLEILAEKLNDFVLDGDSVSLVAENMGGAFKWIATQAAHLAVAVARIRVEIGGLAEAAMRIGKGDFSGAWDAWSEGQKASDKMREELDRMLSDTFDGVAKSQGAIQRRIDSAFGEAGEGSGRAFVAGAASTLEEEADEIAKAAEKAAKAAQREFDKFSSQADGLAEKLFPGHAAAAEAEELLRYLNQFGDQLTEIQRIAVEGRIGLMFDSAAAGVRDLSTHSEKAAKTITKSFDPVRDMFDGLLDALYSSGDAFDNIMRSAAGVGRRFAQMGVDRLFDGLGDRANKAPAASPLQFAQIGREIGTAISPSITSSLNSNLQSYAAAIRKIESGSYEGNYGAMGPVVKGGSYAGDRAYGAYQVMGKNIASWTKEATGTAMSIQQFVADKGAQDKVFATKFNQSLDKFGNFADATSVWFSGRPMSRAGNASDGYNTVPQYVQKANSALDGYSPGVLKTGVSAGMVDASRKIAHMPEMGGNGPEGFKPLGGGGNFQNILGVGSAAFGAFAGGMQSGDPIMGGISGAMSGLGAAPMLSALGLGAMATPVGLIGGAIVGLRRGGTATKKSRIAA